mmetsp:Transcript_25677/g.29805  ORF Transcript_25677/g.29805 Transcript_25677/m.29805 type:complete len:326 (-) Transcript_25677:45-1022(-)|eukprot:CAMPEP_0176458634 /NCGR_PEP_ID=MMETSP0127-20121128/32727_1 /TAXON_ID=938130 /ORGANISM="Platyophrya macrostoma, Strain WH" /LENGTH=325 /DNA_ID=CAMNT_0017849275 /DNA_START=13 /DNA_END=990 /DNA_ORIENTATION=+
MTTRTSRDHNTSKEAAKEPKNQFISKLYEIVEDENNQAYICWDNDGASFLLKDHKLIMEKVVPKYYALTSYSSFLRQLCFYGFKKIKHQQGSNQYDAYQHPNFLRGRTDLLEKIARKKPKSRYEKEKIGEQNSSLEENLKVEEELQLIKELGNARSVISKLRWENEYLKRVIGQLHNRSVYASDNGYANSEYYLMQQDLSLKNNRYYLPTSVPRQNEIFDPNIRMNLSSALTYEGSETLRNETRFPQHEFQSIYPDGQHYEQSANTILTSNVINAERDPFEADIIQEDRGLQPQKTYISQSLNSESNYQGDEAEFSSSTLTNRWF